MAQKGQVAIQLPSTYFSKLKSLLFHPKQFFEFVKQEDLMPSVRFAFINAVLIGLVGAIALLVVDKPVFGVPGLDLVIAQFMRLPTPVLVPLTAIIAMALLFLGAFASAGILQLFAKMFKGIGTYADTCKVVLYTTAPTAVFSVLALGVMGLGTIIQLIPESDNLVITTGIAVIAFLALFAVKALDTATNFWDLYLGIVGIAKIHSLSTWKAVLTLILPGVIILLIAVPFLWKTATVEPVRLQEIERPEIATPPKPETTQISISLAECNKITNANNRDNCNMDNALAQRNVSFCENITDSDFRDGCFSQVALKRLDGELCTHIQLLAYRDGCFIGIAQETRNNQWCDRVTDNTKHDFCLTWNKTHS